MPLRTLVVALALVAASAPAISQASGTKGSAHSGGSYHSAAPVSRPPSPPRPHSVVEVQRASPINRPPRSVFHNHGAVHFWAEPSSFLPVVVWAPVAQDEPSPDALAWQFGQNFFPENGWTENVYEVPPGGEKLLMTFDAPLQFDFMEIVYQDGTAQSVDLSGPARPPGTYGVVDLDPTRAVDHIRVIAQATETVAHLELEAK